VRPWPRRSIRDIVSVTTKYNPARTWTPENAVGIGGAYMCIYGMEGPGGYQFVGRTIQMWNRDRVTDVFEQGKPWLLRFFDQVRFYLVSAEELMELRREFPAGRFTPKIEHSTFKLSDYLDFLEAEAPSIDLFRTMQREAFAAERERWRVAGLDVTDSASSVASSDNEAAVPDGHEAVVSPVSGSLWKFLVKPGDSVEDGQVVVIVEAMKMEIQVASTCCWHGGCVAGEGRPVGFTRADAADGENVNRYWLSGHDSLGSGLGQGCFMAAGP